MGNTLETIDKLWYQTFDWSMIWVCVLAVLVHILYLKINPKNNSKFTIWHYLFYLFSGILVLTFISEVGLKVINHFYSMPVDLEGSVNHFLAAISGLGGAYLVTRIIKMFRKSETVSSNTTSSSRSENNNDEDEDGTVLPGRGF